MPEALPLKTHLSDLNAEQRNAVTSTSRQLLVLAGAGSGKTKTLLQKIIYLIEEKGVNKCFQDTLLMLIRNVRSAVCYGHNIVCFIVLETQELISKDMGSLCPVLKSF